jgi:hypothetical protein
MGYFYVLFINIIVTRLHYCHHYHHLFKSQAFFPGRYPLETILHPTTQAQVSDSRTVIVMCYVPSIALSFAESV